MFPWDQSNFSIIQCGLWLTHRCMKVAVICRQHFQPYRLVLMEISLKRVATGPNDIDTETFTSDREWEIYVALDICCWRLFRTGTFLYILRYVKYFLFAGKRLLSGLKINYAAFEINLCTLNSQKWISIETLSMSYLKKYATLWCYAEQKICTH